MAVKPRDGAEPKRLNRAVGVGEALQKVLDPALRKRGFAGRDIITHWAAMAPAPYDRIAAPDRLAWPRGQRTAEGATLYLRCHPGHALALAHEGPLIAAAVNRYFGYVLVGAVRLSTEPFVPHAEPRPDSAKPEPAALKKVDEALGEVADNGVREALRHLGHGIMGKARQ